jgi:hypothetical protein
MMAVSERFAGAPATLIIIVSPHGVSQVSQEPQTPLTPASGQYEAHRSPADTLRHEFRNVLQRYGTLIEIVRREAPSEMMELHSLLNHHTAGMALSTDKIMNLIQLLDVAEPPNCRDPDSR